MRQVFIILIALAAGAFGHWAAAPLLEKEAAPNETDPTLAARLEAQRRVDEARQNTAPKETVVENPASEVPKEEKPTLTVAQTYGIQNRGPFPVVGTAGHPASGEIEVIESPEEKLVYFKDYEGTPGPDLKVYLATDLEASDVFDLGDAQGTAGNLIYGVPLSVDISDYDYVLTWSESEKVVFDYAKIK